MQKLRNEELNRLRADEYKKAPKHPLIVVLDNVRSMHNVGAAFRTADAFCIEAVYLCGITARPPHRDISKAALGAAQTVNWMYFKNTLDAIQVLKEKKYKIISVEQVKGGTLLRDYAKPFLDKTALVFGHEVNGVSQQVVDISDDCLEIPQCGTKHSLNISVSIGVVLWEILRSVIR